jgi:acetylornithine/N-succinyldiaminopimelate aminotransferase
MTLAKGLGSGMPVGAILAKDRASVFAAGEHGSTFGGNPVTCAAAWATVNYIVEHDISENARQMGQYLADRLTVLKQKFTFITDVRGVGLLQAIEFSDDIARPVVLACLGGGLLVNKLKPNALRFMPPLIINRQDVDEALDILDKSLLDITSKG